MEDERVLKPLFGKAHEEYSFCVIYEQEGELFGVYVWASSIEDAKREVLQRVPYAGIQDVKLDWPR